MLALILATFSPHAMAGAATAPANDPALAADRFAGLPGYAWPANYVPVPWAGGATRMAYVDVGPRSAPPIILLHGQPSWSYMWRHQIRYLVGRGHRVIAPDLIGYGRSDKPEDGSSYSYAGHVAAIQAFVRQLDLTDATLVVHDWGGLIGLNVAARMPERFARLVLLDTSLNDGRDPEPPGFAEGFNRWLRYLETAPLIDAAAVVESQTVRTLSPAERAAYMAPFPDATQQVGLRRMSSLIPRRPEDPHAAENSATRALLASWRRPVMILFSEGSERTHPGQFDRFRNLFPAESVKLAVRIPASRHFVMEDAPDTISALIDAFAAGRPLGGLVAEPAAAAATDDRAAHLIADVETYVGFGAQRTGTPGSAATLEWLERRLRGAGYRLRRLNLPVDMVDIGSLSLTLPGATITDLFPLWPVVPTARDGLLARLAPADSAEPGDIALVRLPHDPRASVYLPGHLAMLRDAASRRPAAILAVTDHPTGELVALNVSEQRPFQPGVPMVVVGNRHAEMLALAAAARSPVQLRLLAETSQTSDSTLIAETGPADAPAIVVSTPRNGWFRAGGERGSGIAVALELAARLQQKRPDRRIAVVFTSHHELGAAGMRAALREPSLAPERVSSWLHVGANAAVRQVGWSGSAPIFEERPTEQRGIAISAEHLADAHATFGDMAGFDIVPLRSDRVVGEVGLIRAGRSHPVVGIVGWQLLHHTQRDDAQTVSGPILVQTADRLLQLLERLP
jgi:haloalkane dehalogenase